MVIATERLGQLHGVAANFYDHLKTLPGVGLTAQVRLAIVKEARSCLMECPSSKRLPQSACLRPNADIFQLLDSIYHEANLADSENWQLINTIARESKQVIIHVVHSVIIHQGRLTRKWYDTIVEKIGAGNIVPDTIIGSHRYYLCHAIFQEIVALSIVSHAIHCCELLLSDLKCTSLKFPSVPTIEEVSSSKAGISSPHYLDWTALTKKGTVRRDEASCFSPYLFPSDIDKKSPEFQKISARGWSEAFDQMNPMNPLFGMTMCGDDFIFVEETSRVFYLSPEAIAMCFSDRLDPKTHCSDFFGRYDLEYVASQVAETHQCAF